MTNILLTMCSWLTLQVIMGAVSFLILIYGLPGSSCAINKHGKNLVCNLQYGPQPWLVRGIYHLLLIETSLKVFIDLSFALITSTRRG